MEVETIMALKQAMYRSRVQVAPAPAMDTAVELGTLNCPWSSEPHLLAPLTLEGCATKQNASALMEIQVMGPLVQT